MFNAVKKLFNIGYSAKHVTKAIVKTGEMLIVPSKFSQMAYKIIVYITTYALIACLIAFAVGNVVKSVWSKIKIDKKVDLNIIILAENADIIGNLLKTFDNAKFKPKVIIAKDAAEFTKESANFQIGIIEGKSNIIALEKMDVFYPINSRNIRENIVHKQAINEVNSLHFEMCKVDNRRLSVFVPIEDVSPEFKQEKSMVIGKLSQSISDIEFGIFLSFISERCVGNFSK